jgi:O-antigen/teichoic acid export membrane protein
MIADLQDEGDSEKLESLFRVNTKWGLYASLPFFVVMILMPGSILSLVFGNEYTSGAVVLRILSLGQLVNVGTGAVGLLLIMKDRAVVWNAILVFSLALNIVLGLLLIPPLGLLGGAIAAASAIAVKFLSALAFVRRDLELWPYDGRYAKGVLAAAGAAIVTALVAVLRSVPLWATVGGGTLLSLLSFGGILLLMGLDEEDRRFLDLAMERVRAGLGRGVAVE